MLEMCLNEKDISKSKFTLSIELKHLNQTLTCFFHERNVVLKVQKIDTRFKIVENLVDVEHDLLLLLVFHEIVKVAQEVMEDVKHQLEGPLLPILDHRCDECVCVL